jgi:hypothetical protein
MRVRVVWLMCGLVAAVTAITYWRLPAGATYHFDDTGPSGAASRLVSYLNFPVALIAIALVGAAARGPMAWAAIVLCAAVALPGVVSQDDLTATWANLPAVIGVALAFWLTWWAPRRWDPPLGRARIVIMVLLAIWSIPWMIASVGLYAQDLPLLGHVINSRQPTPGHPQLASVHRGLHEGLFGLMLVITALLVSRRRGISTALSLYLALMLCYGLAVSFNDGWNEQVVKRGWTSHNPPSVLSPSLSVAWAVVLVAAVLVHRFWFARERF